MLVVVVRREVSELGAIVHRMRVSWAIAAGGKSRNERLVLLRHVVGMVVAVLLQLRTVALRWEELVGELRRNDSTGHSNCSIYDALAAEAETALKRNVLDSDASKSVGSDHCGISIIEVHECITRLKRRFGGTCKLLHCDISNLAESAE